MVDLHPLEIKVLTILRQINRAKVEEIAKKLGIEPVSVSRAAYWLESKGLVEIKQQATSTARLTERGKAEARELPERRLVKFLESGPKNLNEIKLDLSVALGKAKKLGWVKLSKGKVELVKKPEQLPIEIELQKLLQGELNANDLKSLDELKSRGLIEVTDRIQLEIQLKPEASQIELKEKAGTLTQEMLASKKWDETSFRSYDVRAPAPIIYPARLHPLRLLIQKIRRIFLDMGFIEGVGPFVESAFWDMDALFVPQDHPAREMQDTFYMKVPERAKLPDEKIVREVKKAHEEGIENSIGWNYPFSEEESKRTLLRTHTTAVSARNLFRASAPKKVFCIGKVYRNETLDFKHLMETYQVDGIVFDENVTFRNHLAYLKEFFTRMGFPKVRFRPSYFPYTEMSVEVEVYFEPAKAWLELGGSGIFRPEVVVPLTGFDYPVLAWGLGLDRLAMMVYSLEDIRVPYRNDLNWIRSVPVVRGES